MPELGYTILESSTGAIFLDAFVNNLPGGNYGALFISNYNGSEFKASITHTNRDQNGFVDFEKMHGIKGVAVVNEIKNAERITNGGFKQIETKITFDDGLSWNNLKAPSKDFNGKPYSCGVDKECFLHFHAYTERRDKRDQFTVASAVGLMAVVGNVGTSLGDWDNGNVYVTRDGGENWKEVALDAHMYEWGNRGSILLMVKDEGPTNYLLYF